MKKATPYSKWLLLILPVVLVVGLFVGRLSVKNSIIPNERILTYPTKLPEITKSVPKVKIESSPTPVKDCSGDKEKSKELDRIEYEKELWLKTMATDRALISDTIKLVNECIEKVKKEEQNIVICQTLQETVEDLNEDYQKLQDNMDQLDLKETILISGLKCNRQYN